ncbi:hypothetical protein Ahy_A01g000985 isoform L [Arachis hypogaea]|uniref:Uncharacterized protein n=1 Tax=Arachis hypogaea TaxID=3818 RepID=A0A445ELQ9_ARAHY|nr:hypothetical protein Ahy_A01g000985 isoform L [Arachis hypogaea]
MPRRRVTVKEGPGAESSGNKRGAGRKTAGVPSDKGTMPAAKPKGTGPSARPKRTRPTAKPKGSVPHHKPQKTGAAGQTLGEPIAGEAAGSAPVPAPFMAQPSAPAQTPFRPPSQLSRMDQPDSNAAAHTFRPKQPIV